MGHKAAQRRALSKQSAKVEVKEEDATFVTYARKLASNGETNASLSIASYSKCRFQLH